ncbi:hypothetical protein A4X13_0g2792 [Tilletia indica]|uniref:Uncharacterized protein n=1 Tax=Tilletia indica TaxID=43049 RepID=A0A177TSV1_9BASI|nr:hypothetical protein A4X13_0g2792 [Tilletia indica]
MQRRDSMLIHTALRPRPRFPLKPASSLAKIEYSSVLARIHHTLLPLIVYAHVPVTIFLDYNAVFILVQIASNPETSSDGVGAVSATGAVWWFALSIYALADVAWLVGVVIVYEGLLQFGRRWSVRQPTILPIYTSPAAFNLAAFQSFALYSFLYRVRLSASPSQFFTETLWFFSQNWPTIVTLLPRAIICTAILLIYHPDNSSFSTPAGSRDQVYFQADSQLLTKYAFIVLLINVAWASWRILLFALSAILLWIKTGLSSVFRREYINSQAAGESALALRSRSRSRQSEPTLVAADSSGPQNADDLQYTPAPPASRTLGDRSTQAGTPLRPSGEGRNLETRASSYAHYPEDFSSFVDWPLHGWRAHAEERIWNVLENALSAQSEGSSQGHGEVANSAEAQPLSPPRGRQSKESKDVEWVTTEAGEPSAYSQSRATNRHDSDASAGSQFGLGVMDIRRGLSSPTRPFSRTTGKEMTERTTSPSSQMSQQPILRSRPVSAMGILGAAALDAEGRTDKSPKVSPSGNGGGVGTFGRSRHTSLTFAGDFAVPLEEMPGYRDRALLGVPGASRSETAFDSPPLVQRPSPALEPAFHDNSMGALSRHVSMMGSTHGLSTGESSRSAASASASASGPGPDLTTASLGRTTGRLLHPRSASSLRHNAPTSAAAAFVDAESEDRPASPSESFGSHSTIMSEDSEERRIWASFPEQSRRHPPGLIALKMEQREIEAAEAAIAAEASRQRLAAATGGQLGGGGGSPPREDGDRTPRENASVDTLSASPVYMSMTAGSSRDRERELGMDAGSLSQGTTVAGVSGDRSMGGSGLDTLMSISPADRGLIPIKEESWTSGSIDSRQNSLTHSHSNSLSQSSIGGHSSAPAQSMQGHSERMASGDSEDFPDSVLAAVAEEGVPDRRHTD